MSETFKNEYDQLFCLDKEISRLKDKKQEYFLSNIDEKDKNGDIEVPLVVGSNSSDYEKLKEEKKRILCSMEQNMQYIKKIRFYMMGTISDLRKEGLSEEEINTKIEKEKHTYEKRISKLENRLKMIDEDPKLFLRIAECERCDYSKVNNKDAVCKLRDYDEELKDYKKRREALKKHLDMNINDGESQERKFAFSLKPQFNKKKAKKS